MIELDSCSSEERRLLMTNWKAQLGDGKYAIQFETKSKDLYKLVEKACMKAVSKAEKRRDKARGKQMVAVGHL